MHHCGAGATAATPLVLLDHLLAVPTLSHSTEPQQAGHHSIATISALVDFNSSSPSRQLHQRLLHRLQCSVSRHYTHHERPGRTLITAVSVIEQYIYRPRPSTLTRRRRGVKSSRRPCPCAAVRYRAGTRRRANGLASRVCKLFPAILYLWLA